MERSEATYQSYGGVKFTLDGGYVVRCGVLTVAEALRFLEMMESVESDFSVHYQFMQEFPCRLGLAEESLAALGVTLDGPSGPVALEDVTVRQATGLGRLLGDAERGDPNAQYDYLDRLPSVLAIEPDRLSPFETFELGRTLDQQVYSLMYGIARDFWPHLIGSPTTKVMTMRAMATNPGWARDWTT